MRIKYYTTLAEKRQLKIDAHSRRESTIHDDFVDQQGIQTDGTQGRLSFDIKPTQPDRVIKSDDELLLLLFKKRIAYIDLLDLLTIQALKDHASRWEKFKRLFTP